MRRPLAICFGFTAFAGGRHHGIFFLQRFQTRSYLLLYCQTRARPARHGFEKLGARGSDVLELKFVFAVEEYLDVLYTYLHVIKDPLYKCCEFSVTPSEARSEELRDLADE